MKSVQYYRDKAAEAEAIANDLRHPWHARLAHQTMARSWHHCADQAEWLAGQPSIESLRERVDRSLLGEPSRE
jgi:hypothetical protein